MSIENNIIKFKKYLETERRYPKTTIDSYDNDLSNKYIAFLKSRLSSS